MPMPLRSQFPCAPLDREPDSSLSLGSCSLGGDGRVIEAISWPSKSSEFSDEPRGKKESYFKLDSALFSISFSRALQQFKIHMSESVRMQ